MIDEQIHLGHENGREGRVQDVQGVSEEFLRHGKGEPASLVNEIKQQMQQKKPQCQLDQSMLYSLAGGRTEDAVGCAVEESENAVHVEAAAPLQISQAASA